MNVPKQPRAELHDVVDDPGSVPVESAASTGLAPHWPWSHPLFVVVTSRRSRRALSRGGREHHHLARRSVRKAREHLVDVLPHRVLDSRPVDTDVRSGRIGELRRASISPSGKRSTTTLC